MSEKTLRYFFYCACVMATGCIWILASIPSGIHGPITILRIVTFAQKWQTAAAGILAVGAASIAYMAAMAKVNFDRELSQAIIERETIAVLLRLELAALRLKKSVLDMKRSIKHFPDRKITAESFPDLVTPFEEAWSNIEKLPFRAADSIAALRGTGEVLTDFAPSMKSEHAQDTQIQQSAILILEKASTAAGNCSEVILATIGPEIDRLREKVYGQASRRRRRLMSASEE